MGRANTRRRLRNAKRPLCFHMHSLAVENVTSYIYNARVAHVLFIRRACLAATTGRALQQLQQLQQPSAGLPPVAAAMAGAMETHVRHASIM